MVVPFRERPLVWVILTLHPAMARDLIGVQRRPQRQRALA